MVFHFGGRVRLAMRLMIIHENKKAGKSTTEGMLLAQSFFSNRSITAAAALQAIQQPTMYTAAMIGNCGGNPVPDDIVRITPIIVRVPESKPT
jgi:hypothetical protein